MQSKVELATTTINVDGLVISPSQEASHVGVLRNVEGNGPNISARLSAHRKAVFAVLHAGMAKGHRANPAASLRVETVFAVPVLLSGLASIVLTSKEEKTIGQHHKVHLQRLLRLHQSTPAPVIFLLAGCLPIQGLLHLRMFSIFGQLCRLRLGDNILAKHACHVFSSNTSSKSWFWRLRTLCLQYNSTIYKHCAITLNMNRANLCIISEIDYKDNDPSLLPPLLGLLRPPQSSICSTL
jgi:hypothetical protein